VIGTAAIAFGLALRPPRPAVLAAGG
jgi:hypothetical protein